MNFTVDAFLQRVDQIGTTFVQNAYQQLAQALTGGGAGGRQAGSDGGIGRVARSTTKTPPGACSAKKRARNSVACTTGGGGEDAPTPPTDETGCSGSTHCRIDGDTSCCLLNASCT